MATLIAWLAVLGSVLLRAFSQLLTEEFKAWIPWITRFLIKVAVQRFPKDQRERFSEEWAAHLNDVPGKIGEALRCLVAAYRMRPMLEKGPNPPVEENLGKIDVIHFVDGRRVILIEAKVPAYSTVKLDLKSGRIVRVPNE